MLFTNFQSSLYKHLFKPLAFRCDPEQVHDTITTLGQWAGNHSLTRRLARTSWFYADPALRQDVLGMHFSNPIGLAAGFDKDGHLTEILPDVGFGFEEVGSVTGEPCEGNPKPRLWRLPKSQSLVVYYGLKNEGAEVISKRLANKSFRFPVGISVAKTNNPETCETPKGIADYIKAMNAFATIGDYFTINISCPNAFGGEPYTSPSLLRQLLEQTDLVETTHPMFLKMPADLSFDQIDELVNIAKQHRIDGLILSNLTKRYNRIEVDQQEVAPITKGGLSGKPTFEASNSLLKHLYKTVGDRFVLIGTGGIFTAEDAYKKIRSGATLVQLATGMIFQGPQVIGQINQGLVKLLHKDGFTHLKEAIGIDAT